MYEDIKIVSVVVEKMNHEWADNVSFSILSVSFIELKNNFNFVSQIMTMVRFEFCIRKLNVRQ